MAGNSNIEWTEVTWNPTTGCTKVSAGCKNCYAENWATMQQARGIIQYKKGFKLNLAPKRLNDPFRWRNPKVVFVNSMSDLFHEDIDTEYIKQVFRVMNETPSNTYQILTKRIERVIKLKKEFNWTRNIWLGVSVENNIVKNRITNLKKIPAAVRFISFEPLIEKINNLNLSGINWVIVGGESGYRARKINYEWVIDIKQKCAFMSIPFFFKQWGNRKSNPDIDDPTLNRTHKYHSRGGCMINKKICRAIPRI